MRALGALMAASYSIEGSDGEEVEELIPAPLDEGPSDAEEELGAPEIRKQGQATFDSQARKFADEFREIWKNPEGNLHKALMQRTLNSRVFGAFLVGLLATTILGALFDLTAGLSMTQMVIGRAASVAVMGFGLAMLILTLRWNETHRAQLIIEQACSAISDGLVERILRSRAEEIHRHINHLSFTKRDGHGSDPQQCVVEVSNLWREISLIPYLLDKEWKIFKYAFVMKNERRRTRPFFIVSLIGYSALYVLAGIIAALALHNEGQPTLRAAIAGGTVAFFGWAQFMVMAMVIRNQMRDRMSHFVAEIEERLGYYFGDGKSGKEEWMSVIARYDPAPIVGKKLKDAYEFIARSRQSLDVDTGERGGRADDLSPPTGKSSGAVAWSPPAARPAPRVIRRIR
ncbi:excinuclease ABC subunit B [Parvularcula bermudensis HTCC2503]|uniref:Excinuclease ABC subunit B n=2 Tax=Parvularcula TaxID=208215 RepID=E0TBX3_PARBH|nr:excinuclease ABC subunit B [Parvularcula bermudensis HTCC2503]